MRLAGERGTLGYCLNVHPTQTADEVLAALRGPAAELKRRLSPDRPFGVGLRLSAEAAAAPGMAAELAAVCAGEGFEPFTMNGFPYGRFHAAPVKEAVYEPDWSMEARGDYSIALARIMAALAPPGGFATISTVPVGFAPRTRLGERIVAELLRVVAELVRLERETGRTVALALEPEPWCVLETAEDAAGLFRHLFTPDCARQLAALAGLTTEQAADALPRHLGLCLDVCHMAVAFEEPEAAFATLAASGIPVHKMQLSAALRLPRADAAARARAAAFADDVYLHQTVARATDGTVRRFLDLPEALAQPVRDDEEWRVHCHVPVFADLEPPLASTRDVLERVLALHRASPVTRHLEVETYSWSVLPPAARGGMDVTDGIEKELRWALQRLS